MEKKEPNYFKTTQEVRQMEKKEPNYFKTTQELIQYLRSTPVEPKKLEDETKAPEEVVDNEQVLQTD